jgi:hypothetical protein
VAQRSRAARTEGPRRLALAGVAAILIFATIGQFSHHGGVSIGGYAADVLPLAGSWVALAWWTGRFLPTWLGGVTLGVAIRMVVLGHERWSELSFLLVALVVIGAISFPLLWLMELRAARSDGSASSSSTAPGR